ncbi:MAG: GAF domain-containing protein [Shimia sp.]
MSIGDGAGSCGTAAFTRAPVFVTDIATDPLWKDFRDLALPHGLAACWSVPIRATDGSVIGTFANYYPEPREPSDEDMAAINILGQTAGVAVERHRAELFRLRVEGRAKLAMQRSGTVGAFETDLKASKVYSDRTCAELHGVEAGDPELGTPLEDFFDAILDEDRDPVRAALDEAARSGADFDRTYRVRADDRRPRWVHAQGTVYRDRHDVPERLIGIVVDLTGSRAEALMQEARAGFLERVPALGSNSEIAALSSRLTGEALFAGAAGLGTTDPAMEDLAFSGVWSKDGVAMPQDPHQFGAFGSYAAELDAGRTVLIEDVRTDACVQGAAELEASGVRALALVPLMSDGAMVATMLVADDAPRRWTEGEATFIAGMLDRTYVAMDRLTLARERDMLSGELVHRMKNILTIAQVIVNQTLRPLPGVKGARAAIGARLSALAAAQDILTGGDDKDAGLHDVIETALAPHLPGEDRLALDGAPLPLNSQQVLGLSLALHELATNAAKYGAWSVPGGRVEIAWTGGDGAFRLDWREAGGPLVAEPERTGFGSTVLGRLVGGYFGGTSSIVYDPDGVRFEIRGGERE